MTTWNPVEGQPGVLASSDGVQTLDQLLNFNNPPIRVNSDGTLTTETLYAPDAFDMGEEEADVLGQARSAGWELVSGYSRHRPGYAGPVMHPSEFIGGGMARAILATPGVYAVASVDDSDDGYPVGWVLMRKVGA